MADATGEERTFLQKMLDGIESVGNRVPHPAIIFLGLIGLLFVVSHIFYLLGANATFEVVVPEAISSYEVVVPETLHDYEAMVDPQQYEYLEELQPVAFETAEVTEHVRSLLNADGIRFIFTSAVSNFQQFGVVAVIIVAMIGVGLAEEAGLISALIKRLVQVTPGGLITPIIVFIGVLSSIATDAGYLVLIPLAAAVFLTLGRHPIAGMAAAFAGVGGAFGVNLLITPVDAMLTEITNEAIAILDPTRSMEVTHNFFFGIVSTVLLTILGWLITARLVEPRLGKYTGDAVADPNQGVSAAEAKGLQRALLGLIGFVIVIGILSIPSWGPLRHPETGALLGNSPFMDSIIFLVMLAFLITGWCYGTGAGTIKNSLDVINPMVKTIASLSGLIFLLVIISQFLAYFNFSNLGTVGAVTLGDALQDAGLGPIPLLIGLVLATFIVDIFIGGVVPKWALFAPIFVPLMMRLDISPELATAAYRVGDSPMNIVTPLMPYFAFIVTVAQRYEKKAGVGSVISLMLPYMAIFIVAWTLLLILWYILGIPLGPGAPVRG